MTTLAEIEKAADALPFKQQQALLRHLTLNLTRLGPGTEPRETWPVPPPDVPIEELRRIHAIIEAEFAQAGSDGS